MDLRDGDWQPAGAEAVQAPVAGQVHEALFDRPAVATAVVELVGGQAQVGGDKALEVDAVGVGVADDDALQGDGAGAPGHKVGQVAQFAGRQGAVFEFGWRRERRSGKRSKKAKTP